MLELSIRPKKAPPNITKPKDLAATFIVPNLYVTKKDYAEIFRYKSIRKISFVILKQPHHIILLYYLFF